MKKIEFEASLSIFEGGIGDKSYMPRHGVDSLHTRHFIFKFGVFETINLAKTISSIIIELGYTKYQVHVLLSLNPGKFMGLGSFSDCGCEACRMSGGNNF